MKKPRGNREVSRPPRGFLLLNVFESMPSCTLPSLSGKVATSVAQLTEEVKQRNFYIYAYSIKLAYMTSIGTPCHFPR